MIRFNVIVAPEEIEQVSNQIISYFNLDNITIDKWNKHNPEQLEIVRIKSNIDDFFITIFAYFGNTTISSIIRSGRTHGYVISRSLRNILSQEELVVINGMNNIRWHQF